MSLYYNDITGENTLDNLHSQISGVGICAPFHSYKQEYIFQIQNELSR